MVSLHVLTVSFSLLWVATLAALLPVELINAVHNMTKISEGFHEPAFAIPTGRRRAQ